MKARSDKEEEEEEEEERTVMDTKRSSKVPNSKRNMLGESGKKSVIRLQA